MASINIIDKDGNEAEASTLTTPLNRYFRDAWVLNGLVISEDIDTAKEIFKETIRQTRVKLFEPLDTAFMKALETGTDTSAIVASKQALRDATTAGDSATTIDELKNAWPSCCGINPYA